MKQKTLFIVASILLLVGFAAGMFIYNQQQQEAANQLAAANRAALLRMHAPSLGKADAPVVIVEFLDPACETCAAFYPRVKELMAAHPDKIRLVLRYAPFHPGSDKVVAVLEAARRQDKFWPALEALLANQNGWTQNHVAYADRTWKHLDGLGLNMEQMAFDITAPEIAGVIEQDLADARSLKVSKTPEFFVNGKPLPSFGFAQLQALVEQALAETSQR
ncbi:MAG: disulfide bond formation protein DsbA [Betaproteobacteria bacterium HGW-Betaproteobacteria-7]|jgi:protein-disulfide isomerase|nr:MAG: disulfide bond formation protein DsbA [Betaproteobacteria bacterium HGW-Betaproteobacteria-7]